MSYRGLLFGTCFLLTQCGDHQRYGKESYDPKNVFGQDDRRDLSEKQYPTSALGFVDTGCTGTLVGESLVLTAAHCVFDGEKKQVHPNLKQFFPQLIAGQSEDPTSIIHIWFGSEDPEKERQSDWALLKLDKPIGKKYQWMDLRKENFSDKLPFEINLAGYSQDRNEGKTASIHERCQLRRIVTGDRILHDCDATGGVSGGPLFRMENSRAVILAISVSEYRRGAPDSVKRDQYDDLYANVGIGAEHFIATWEALRNTVDKGQPAPQLPNVKYLKNPNVVETPPPPPTDPQSSDNVDLNVMRQNYRLIQATLQRLQTVGNDLQRFASKRYMNDLSQLSSDFVRTTTSLDDANQRNYNRQPVPLNQMEQLIQGMKMQVSNIDQTSQRTRKALFDALTLEIKVTSQDLLSLLK